MATLIQLLTTWSHDYRSRCPNTLLHYLLGLEHPTVILSDHKNLTYFQMAHKLNRQQARWSLFLSEFDLKLIHIPGSQMVQSDTLSRRADHIPGEDTDNKDMTLLLDNLFAKFIDTDMHDLFAKQIMKDNIVHNTITALKEQGTPLIKSSLSDWKVEDGLLFFKDRCYVPDNGGDVPSLLGFSYA